MQSLHAFLTVSATTLLLLSCALARSIQGESMHRTRTPSLSPQALVPDLEPYGADGARTLADLLDSFSAFYHHQRRGHVIPDVDQSRAALELGSVKRSWGQDGGFLVPSGMKRKMFWTPLGHLPASARLGRPQALRPTMEDSGSPVFRYG